MIRVADYIADFIYRQGVSHVFMLSGGGSIYLDDGVACHPHLKHICARNEAAAPMMAEAYARLTGNLGAVYVTTGPGGANAVSGLAEAWVDSAPVLVISGQAQRDHTTYNAGVPNLRTFGIQELNIVEIVDSITKYAVMVNDPTSIRYHLERAVSCAKSGRPGPVWLDIPLDVQSAPIDPDALSGYEPEVCNADDKVLSESVDRILSLLQHARKPLIIAGQGVRIAGATDELKKLIETLRIPVMFSRLGQDILPYSHALNVGHGGYTKGLRYANIITRQSDCVLVLGSRLSVAFVGTQLNAFSPEAKIVVVDVDPAELAKPGVKIDLPVQADVGVVLRMMLDRCHEGPRSICHDWLDMCAEYKDKQVATMQGAPKNPIDLYYFVGRLDALSQEGDIFISDAGSSYYVAGQALKFEKSQREVTSGAFASMGLTIPLAIGAATADPAARILAITGDGSLELNIQELKNISYYGMNIKLFVINNGGYVSIRNTQDALCGGRYINSDQMGCDELLDFSKVADAFDLPYFIIRDWQEVDDGIRRITREQGPAFVEVVCDSKQTIMEPLSDVQ